MDGFSVSQAEPEDIGVDGATMFYVFAGPFASRTKNLLSDQLCHSMASHHIVRGDLALDFINVQFRLHQLVRGAISS